MARNNTGGGSILLKILILVLIALLYASVEIPSRQWKKQESDLQIARKRMENVNTATLQYLYFNRSFPHTFNDIRSSLDTCKMVIRPIDFSADDKQLNPEILRDSLLIVAEDSMRIESFGIRDAGRVTLDDGRSMYHTLIWAKMKPLFKGVGTDTLHLYSEEKINAWPRNYGESDFSLWASSASRFDREVGGFVHGDSTTVHVTNYSFSLPFDEIFTCPTTGKPFEMYHVAKYSYTGEYLFVVGADSGEVVSSKAKQQAFFAAVRAQAADRIATDFMTVTDSAKADGNTSFQVPDKRKNKIVVDAILEEIGKLKPGQKLAHSSQQKHTARADSAAFFTADSFVVATLFPEIETGSQSKQHKTLIAKPDVVALLENLRLSATLDSVKIDTVGLAIYSPIVGDEVYTEGLMRIFEVDPPENHGNIYNGTTSWE